MSSTRIHLLAMGISLTLVSIARAQFASVINVPPDAAPGSIDSDTQLNLFPGGVIDESFTAGDFFGGSTNVEVNISGGSVGSFFRASRGSTVNISGGSVGAAFSAYGGSMVNIAGGSLGNSFHALRGSTVNISGGSVNESFVAFDGSTVNISGGSFGDVFLAQSGSTVNISGGDIRLNGVIVEGLDTVGNTLALNLPLGAVLSGTFADGTPFAYANTAEKVSGDFFDDGALTLTSSALPAVGPPVIMLPGDPVPLGVRTGQTLVVQDGGELPDNFNAGRGSTVNIEAGANVGDNFEAVGARVNISGGSVGREFNAFVGSTVNIFGGWVDGRLDAFDGSAVNISGGSVEDGFLARSGSTVNVSGGTVGDAGGAISGSRVNISGGAFRLDGVILEGLDTVGNTLALNLPPEAVLSGTLADGTPFVYSSVDRDFFGDGTLTLTAAALPAPGPPVIMLPGDPAPQGVRTGQTMVVQDRGHLPNNFQAGRGSTVNIEPGANVGANFEAVGARVNISGGRVRNDFDAFGGTVNISGGSVASDFDAYDGSTVNIAGGSVGDYFGAFSGSTVNISGGSVGHSFDAFVGSTVNISGGSVASRFDALEGSTVTISGGSFGRDFEALDGSTVNIAGGSFGDAFLAHGGSMVNISGGEFRLDGVIVEGLDTVGNTLAFNLPPGAVLSGTLADGTPFSHSSIDRDSFDDGTLTLTAAALPAPGPPLIMLPGGPTPLGVRTGQTLVVQDKGTLPDNFKAGRDSTVNIEAGANVGENFEAVGALVNISGGSVGTFFDAFDGSTVNVSGGRIGDSFDAFDGSTVNISGGSVGRDFDAFEGSTVNLFGAQFVLDQMDITGLLTPDVPFTINDRDVTLSGLLADGSPFEFDLISVHLSGQSHFDPGATLTVTLRQTILIGDTNADGLVNIDDLNNVRNNFGGVGHPDGTLTGDAFPYDGLVNIDDLNAVRNKFGAGATVPEPSAAALAVIAAVALPACRSRRRR